MAMRSLEEARLSAGERAALEAAARALRARFPVDQLLLFGSKARGAGDEDSDLDLLVVTSRTLDWRERGAIVDALFDIELAHDALLSPLIVSRADWQDGPYTALALHAEVTRDGIPF